MTVFNSAEQILSRLSAWAVSLFPADAMHDNPKVILVDLSQRWADEHVTAGRKFRDVLGLIVQAFCVRGWADRRVSFLASLSHRERLFAAIYAVGILGGLHLLGSQLVDPVPFNKPLERFGYLLPSPTLVLLFAVFPVLAVAFDGFCLMTLYKTVRFRVAVANLGRSWDDFYRVGPEVAIADLDLMHRLDAAAVDTAIPQDIRTMLTDALVTARAQVALTGLFRSLGDLVRVGPVVGVADTDLMRRLDAAAVDTAIPQDTRTSLTQLIADVLVIKNLDTAMSLTQLGLLLQTQGDLSGAYKQVERALEIWQAAQARHGEQASFFQLGALAIERGRFVHGACLVATGVIIGRAIGQADVEQEQHILTTYAELLGSQEQMDQVVQLAHDAYQVDRGHHLIHAAFAA